MHLDILTATAIYQCNGLLKCVWVCMCVVAVCVCLCMSDGVCMWLQTTVWLQFYVIYINTLTSTNDASRAVIFAILTLQTFVIIFQGSNLIFKAEICMFLFQTWLMYWYSAIVKNMFGLLIALINNNVLGATWSKADDRWHLFCVILPNKSYSEHLCCSQAENNTIKSIRYDNNQQVSGLTFKMKKHWF